MLLSGLSILFWSGLAVVFYTYVGYAPFVWALSRLRRWWHPRPDRTVPPDDDLPAVTLLVAAYNEADVIDEKLANTRALNYPREKLTVLFVTDGSTDTTPDRLRTAPGVQCLHRDERAGKMAALHRGMEHVETPIVVFSDANAMLNADALRNLVRHYQDASVGAVAGEKRVRAAGADDASGASEGLYWRYESALRRWDDALHSVVGAAGELFSVRTALFDPISEDTILDDFVLTLRVAARGYRVAYAPDAYATEGPSASLADEMQRKVRIVAGGFQALGRLRELFNPVRHGTLTFQFVSHRVLRWTLAPALLPVLLITNGLLVGMGGGWAATLLLAGRAPSTGSPHTGPSRTKSPTARRPSTPPSTSV
jgi:Glycosyltransferases, probably involved in cell wall biogenesis